MSEELGWLLGAARLSPTSLAVAALAGRAGFLAGAVWLVLVPFVQPASLAGPGLITRLLLELAVGTAFALALTAPLLAARHAGRMLELGYGVRWGTSGALAAVFGWTWLALFAALGGLRVWARALLELPGVTSLDGALLGALAEASASFVTQLLRLSLVIAAPAWVAFVLLDAGLSLATRLSGAPGRAIVGLSMPLRLASVVVALPLAAEHLPEWVRTASHAASRWAVELLT